MGIQDDVRRLLRAHKVLDADEARFLDRMRDLLDSPQPFARAQSEPGHFTASAYVLHPTERAVLLVEHRVLGRWLQPGGHVEPADVDVWSAAAREVREECGVDGIEPLEELFDLDVHTIPENPRKSEPRHEHFDLRVLARALNSDLRAGSDARAARWVPVEALGAVLDDASAARVMRRLARW